MAPQYGIKIEHNGNLVYPPPFSLLSLDGDTRTGVLVLASFGLLSAVATASMASLMIYRMVQYRLYSNAFAGPQQYLVLVLNLLLADCQQSVGFVLGYHWIQENGILAPTAACFAQGWLLNVGDVSSALFVLLIAIHTFATAACGKRISPMKFATMVFSVWLLAFFFSGIGVILHGGKIFVKAATWCWIASSHEKERLFFHYFWIFLSEFGSVILYAVTFIKLRSTTQSLKKAHVQDHHRLETIAAVNRISVLMMLYPVAYIICTLPVSIGRMWTMAHASRPWSEEFGTAGAVLLTSCGWIDVMLYTLTRRRLMSVLRPRQASEELTSAEAGPGMPTDQPPSAIRDSGKALEVGLFELADKQSPTEDPHAKFHKPTIAVREQEKQTHHNVRPRSRVARPQKIPFMPPNPSRQDVAIARTDPREYRHKHGFHLSRFHDLPRPAHLNAEKNKSPQPATMVISPLALNPISPFPPISDEQEQNEENREESTWPLPTAPRSKGSKFPLQQIALGASSTTANGGDNSGRSTPDLEQLGILPPAYSLLETSVGGRGGRRRKDQGGDEKEEGGKEGE